MAIAPTTMSRDDHRNKNIKNHHGGGGGDDEDQHDQDMVMPGFRFHPTEEELVEFYLRRKVEGKRFNVELITFLDLYRYDPWELPALAAIGEKEWFFYVPRDRKYRNGDRPNRVTTSGYWKATGADRMIRTENFRSIGLKKTLVFYSGKAPKGIRTSWIMNEYRLPHHETEKLQKAEISLCRVYKRPGVEDHPSLPRSLPTRASSSSRGAQPHKKQLQDPTQQHLTERFQAFRGQNHHQVDPNKMSETSGSSCTEGGGTALGLSNPNPFPSFVPITAQTLAPPTEEVRVLVPNCTTIFTCPSFVPPPPPPPPPHPVDDLQRLINYQQASISHHQQQYYQNHQTSQFMINANNNLQPQSDQSSSSSLALNLPASFADQRLWEWNSLSSDQANKDYTNPFK